MDHSAHDAIGLLKRKFGGRVISGSGPVNSLPRSCDLTPLAFFLCCYVKSLVYANKATTLKELRASIPRKKAIVTAENKSFKKESNESTAPNETALAI